MESTLTWHKKKYELPTKSARVLVYSPQYNGVDESMVFRVMDAQFVRIASDVSMWAYIEKPKGPWR